MFLNKLTDQEKEAFISLSIHAANADTVFVEEEKALIQDYCKEMGIVFFDSSSIMPLEELKKIYADSSINNKKIVLFELLGLVYVDGKYDNEEKNFINEFAEAIGLSAEEVAVQTKLIEKYIAILGEIMQALL